MGSPSALDTPALKRLWDQVAERLQRNGLSVDATVTLDSLGQDERFALAGLLGRPVTADRCRVDLAVLDRRLRESGAARGLVAAADQCRGPLVDRRSLRAGRLARREAVWASWRAQLAALGLDAEGWCEVWAESLRPLVGGDPSPSVSAALAAATRCVASLARERAAGVGPGRGELAARFVGDSHGFDDGALAGTMVLRAIAARFGSPAPATAEERRGLWEKAGVLCDEISTTVLCRGLMPPGSAAAGCDPASLSLGARSAAGLETHLTMRDLRRLGRIVESGMDVFVCENPRVLEAAMDAGSPRAIVCTAGNPTLIATRLLERLAADGARLHYRGDFDWPGVGIANRVIERFGAMPWRMSAADYEAALAAAGADVVDLPLLEGRPVAAAWDRELGPAMARAGRAVHEERLLELLVSDVL